MTLAQWNGAMKPKVDGAWNLHTALLNHKLDFFFLASSIITAVHQPGQSNYCAANVFLEALCQYRQGLGLPASVLSICPILGSGFVAESAQAQRNMRAQGIYNLNEQAYLDYVEHSLLLNTTQLAPTGPLTTNLTPWKNDAHVIMGLRSETDLEDPFNRTNWRRDRRMGSYHNVQGDRVTNTTTDLDELKLFLSRAQEGKAALLSEEAISFLGQQIGRKVHSIMLRPEGEEVDLAASPAQMGVDSLMATELRRWFRQVFGVKMGVLEILSASSLTQLGRAVAEGLSEKFGGRK